MIAVINPKTLPPRLRSSPTRWRLATVLLALPLWASQAHASIFKGEALDKVADILSWVVLIVAPVVGLAVFWIVHILPEKIAEKRKHPQAKAIQTLCLLSLVFGGLLWPIAWLWAYSKPVLYKMAYGTDKVPHGEGDHGDGAQADEEETAEVDRLRQRIAELESKLSGKGATEGGKA
ncbi:MAG: DUF3302 domain-containing protein [Opitutaceae bacterium]